MNANLARGAGERSSFVVDDASRATLRQVPGLLAGAWPSVGDLAACFNQHAVAMARQHTIVKRLDAVQNLGAMDILCTDKTGTLTLDEVGG